MPLQIVALAGGSGITPFYSMVLAIRDETEALSLTIIYGARTEQDLIFKKELDALLWWTAVSGLYMCSVMRQKTVTNPVSLQKI